jgi:metal-responsive CopG/Arc/MetJ family transcriptional regulator
MKERLSVTIDRELVLDLNKVLDSEYFRNKSHLVEIAIKKYLMEKQDA